MQDLVRKPDGRTPVWIVKVDADLKDIPTPLTRSASLVRLVPPMDVCLQRARTCRPPERQDVIRWWYGKWAESVGT